MAVVEVASNGAIYVNDHRITNRSTKPYGYFSSVFEAKVDKRSVVRTLVAHGYDVSKIDEEYYIKQREKL